MVVSESSGWRWSVAGIVAGSPVVAGPRDEPRGLPLSTSNFHFGARRECRRWNMRRPTDVSKRARCPRSEGKASPRLGSTVKMAPLKFGLTRRLDWLREPARWSRLANGVPAAGRAGRRSTRIRLQGTSLPMSRTDLPASSGTPSAACSAATFSRWRAISSGNGRVRTPSSACTHVQHHHVHRRRRVALVACDQPMEYPQALCVDAEHQALDVQPLAECELAVPR